MTAILPPHDWLCDPATRQLMQHVEAAGGEIRFVGGCVRDGWLGLPVQDLDMACSLEPEPLMALLDAQGIRTIATGIAHGTITAILDHTAIEITTLRKDVACDGRHAEVAFTTDWEADAARRDFTINALSADRQGRVYDYTDGLADLDAGRVRFIGDAATRIREDRLRILRFFRFWSGYGKMAPDPVALQACREAAASLASLSGERIRQELRSLMDTPHLVEAWQHMQASAVAPALLGTEALTGWLAALVALPEETDDWRLRIAAILRESSVTADYAATHWRLSRNDALHLRGLITTPLWKTAPDIWAVRRQHRQLGAERTRQLLLLSLAARKAGAEPVDSAAYAEALADCLDWQPPAFPITGSMLQARGLEGKAIGEAMQRLEAFWEAERYAPDAEALLSGL